MTLFHHIDRNILTPLSEDNERYIADELRGTWQHTTKIKHNEVLQMS
jgi:hypothetical protein